MEPESLFMVMLMLTLPVPMVTAIQWICSMKTVKGRGRKSTCIQGKAEREKSNSLGEKTTCTCTNRELDS